MAGIHMNGLLITARTRDLSPSQARDLVEAAETALGPEGISKLFQGDFSQIPGDTYLDRAEAVLPVLKAFEDKGTDVTAALSRMSDELDHINMAREAENAKDRPAEQASFIVRSQDHDRDDGWDL